MNLSELDRDVAEAVQHFWKTREIQHAIQRETGHADQGQRSAVTGGAQMHGFASLISRVLVSRGVRTADIHGRKAIELPGFFRPTKQWDLLVVINGVLAAAIEMKSQVGPSFGNNYNNRIEEAIGSAQDLWTAYRENAFMGNPAPFLGYILLLEDCPEVRRPVAVHEPHFAVLPEFVDASYVRRYELFCRRLILERLYSATAFITSPRKSGLQGAYGTPADDLGFARFIESLIAHVSRFV